MIYVVHSNNIYIGVYNILYYIHYSLPNNNNLVPCKFPDILTIRIFCGQHHIVPSTFNISHIT